MIKAQFIILLICLGLVACGGARRANDVATTVSVNSQLIWNPPTTYTDNSPLPETNIGGFHVYYGPTSDNLQRFKTFNATEERKFHLQEIGKGKFFISVTCFDTDGLESNFSPIILVEII